MSEPRGLVARLLSRLTGGLQLERTAALDAKVTKFGRVQREELAEQRRLLDQIVSTLSTRAEVRDVRAVDRRVEDVQISLLRQDRAISEALERAGRLDEQARDDRRFARRIESFLRHDRPIVVGPWTGEVGFELLYWVPFVRWVAATYGIPAERLIVVSRGGAEPWYQGLAGRYIDLFSHFSPDEFRAATEEAKKQRSVGEFDVRAVQRILDAVRLPRTTALLHPGMMYRLFWPVWKELATAARVRAYTQYARISAPADAELGELPRPYIAARFYFSDCFPDTPANRTFVTTTIETLSSHMPVVLLNTPFAVDDHRDFQPAAGRVFTVAQHMTPERNLAIQTSVIARAQAFVGTYGGYSYLAPFCGVGALAFYSAHTFKDHHLHVAQHAIGELGGATLVPLDVTSLPFVRLVLPGAPVAAR